MSSNPLTRVDEDFNPRELRTTFACFPSGVTAVCARIDDHPVGMAASSFTAVSLSPALVSVCVDNASSTWPQLRRRGVVGVSVLSGEHDAACRQLSAKTGDRFAGLAIDEADSGAIWLAGAVAWFECAIASEIPAGDHHIVLLEVKALWRSPSASPLVFHGSQFRRLSALDALAS